MRCHSGLKATEEAMVANKKDQNQEKRTKQGPDLGQREAALEKEKEAEMHHMGKGQPSADRNSETRAKHNPGPQK